MELQTYFVNRLVRQALQKAGHLETGVSKFDKLLYKIINTKYTTVDLSAAEVETLLLALLQEMQNYTSVTVKEYRLKKAT